MLEANGINFDVVKTTEIFLLSGSILVGALGVARTEGLKSGISALGLYLTVLWFVCVWGAYGAEPNTKPWRLTMLAWMPAVFLVSWIVSFAIHVQKYIHEKEVLRKRFMQITQWFSKRRPNKPK